MDAGTQPTCTARSPRAPGQPDEGDRATDQDADRELHHGPPSDSRDEAASLGPQDQGVEGEDPVERLQVSHDGVGIDLRDDCAQGR